METLGKLWDVVAAHWVLILLAVLAVGAVVAFVWWRKKNPSKRTPDAGTSPAIASNRLLRARQRFLSGMELVKRAAMRELPTVVVFGPLRAGKTELIQLDADYEAQKRQYLPSYVDDELMQLYAGPNTVVQEVSAKLLEDESPEARRALQRLWKECFVSKQQGLAVITLRVDWLVDTLPDDQKRIAQFLRGKLNLISEACRVPVETRICVTHLDLLPGFTDFADLMHQHGGSLTFTLPRPSGPRVDATELAKLEQELVTLLEAQERFLSLGLTTLSVEAFGRLERFFSQSGKAFKALARFVTSLREGSALSLQPDLQSLYLSFKPTKSTEQARPVGALSLSTTEQQALEQRKRYLRKHLRNCAVIAAICCLPVLAAHGNFYLRLRSSEKRLEQFATQMAPLPAHHDLSLFEGQVVEVGQKMNELWKAMGYWPPLKSSHPQRVEGLKTDLAAVLRQVHLKPTLEQCGKSPHACRPEQLVHLLAILYSSRDEDLGRLVIKDSWSKHRWEWAPETEHYSSLIEQRTSWVSALGLNESLVEDYVLCSNTPWQASIDPKDDWARWPFQRELSGKAQLQRWMKHLQELKRVMQAESCEELAKLEELRPEREALKGTIEDSVIFGSSLKRMRPYMEKVLLSASSSTPTPPEEARKKLKTIQGSLDSIQESLDWVNDNRQTLTALLTMEEDAYDGWKAVEKLSIAARLTRDGLWDTSSDDGNLNVVSPASQPEAPAQPLPVAQQPKLPAQQAKPPAQQAKPSAQQTKPDVRLASHTSSAQAPLQVTVAQNYFDFIPQKHSRELMRMLIDKDACKPANKATADAKDATDATKETAEQKLLRLNFEFYTQHKPLVDEFTQLMQSAQLSPTEAPQRQELVRQQVDTFALNYREALFDRVSAYNFEPTPSLYKAMGEITQPASKLVDMLRDVSSRANLEPMEGPYYDSVRNAVTPFSPIVQLMVQDKNGNYTALDAYRMLLARFIDELNASKPSGGKDAKEEKADKADKAAEGEADGPPKLTEKLSPLGRLALSMLLEEKGSYLREVDAWMDAQGLIGPLRVPFRKPFELARDLGRQEIQDLLRREWDAVASQKLWPLLERYPFRPESLEELEPSQLEVLRRKDGSFWQFVERMISPVCEERGTQWALRSALRGRLALPSKMLTTLGRVSELSRVLWDDEGKPRPLMLQVMPQPLPPSPAKDWFITMATLKCGKATASSYNQAPSWQDFPVTWWSQPTASLSLEQRSPKQEKQQYSTLEKSSSWSCFRLLESSATFSSDQLRTWRLHRRGAEPNSPAVELKFRVRGEPWTPFREVVR
ncbi:type VI secretion protein IcmF/TssM N-terminal domain-containing protein [Archangium lansingense]|uniref:Uncharacterized protein n=1 Tax=Archangium lansingense TaxID=2995310 RepID=A0ABT4A0H0_9BACT|nr:type VI secretion protein IcmF/TssM N-terminal domain-containing protein [Archangium lansinium]MCY1075140.1 hypothetical protein [Archangium lansinium]